ncbi:MAG TPA: hypothetical protein VK989_03345, partial [Polyangia bacterium]|nr:hypothetical protein [Polyangia bacterium]
RIAPSANTCEFAGTIRVHVSGEESWVEVLDTYDRFKATYASFVRGCDLKKAIGVVVTPDELRAALQRARRPGPPDGYAAVKTPTDRPRACKDRRDFDEHRNCILDPSSPAPSDSHAESARDDDDDP